MKLSRPQQIYGIDISYDLDRSRTIVDGDIREKKTIRFNVDDSAAQDKKAEAKKQGEAEAQSWVKRNAGKIGDLFQGLFSGKSTYYDQRTDVQREIDRLGGIWTDKRPMYNGVSAFDLLMSSASPGGSIHNYLDMNGRVTYVNPLLNVIAAYRLGPDKPGYNSIPTSVLNIAVSFVQWANLVYGKNFIAELNLSETDRKFIRAFKQQATPEEKDEIEKREKKNEESNKDSGATGAFSDLFLWVIIIIVAVLLIGKFFK